jgi:hypothetical protein
LLLQPLLKAVLDEPKVVILEPDSVRRESIGISFRAGKKI